ncbi:hypothetical protein THF1D04_360004 [Vibrio owensii]|uniref:Uncharacterized protein n=1 Tax=Vibrio owensii TaxID=696485 RepID=A0AAU9Q9N9_9VIBR|nr:hypothetical protein THF1D04_360004 [Vibrio owensii]
MDDTLTIAWLDFHNTPWRYAHSSWLPQWLLTSLNNAPSLNVFRNDLHQYFETNNRLSFPRDIELCNFLSFDDAQRTLYDDLVKQTLFGGNDSSLSGEHKKWCYGLSLAIRSGDIIHFMPRDDSPENIVHLTRQHWFFYSEPALWSQLKLLFPKKQVLEYSIDPLPAHIQRQIERLGRAITNKVISHA